MKMSKKTPRTTFTIRVSMDCKKRLQIMASKRKTPTTQSSLAAEILEDFVHVPQKNRSKPTRSATTALVRTYTEAQ